MKGHTMKLTLQESRTKKKRKMKNDPESRSPPKPPQGSGIYSSTSSERSARVDLDRYLTDPMY